MRFFLRSIVLLGKRDGCKSIGLSECIYIMCVPKFGSPLQFKSYVTLSLQFKRYCHVDVSGYLYERPQNSRSDVSANEVQFAIESLRRFAYRC